MSEIESGVVEEGTNEVATLSPRPLAPAAPRPRGRPKKHTVLPGDKISKPTELDMLAAATIPDLPDETDDSTARSLLADISALKADGRRWNSYSSFQRYAMLGAATALQQVLGEVDFNGKPANFNQLLGVNIRTHRNIGANSPGQ